MFTGTLYYKGKDIFKSADSLVSFSTRGMEYYDDEKFGVFCSTNSLPLIKLAMKLAYYQTKLYAKKKNIIFVEKNQIPKMIAKGASTLEKLEKEHESKIKCKK